jgi:hypothetical protein
MQGRNSAATRFDRRSGGARTSARAISRPAGALARPPRVGGARPGLAGGCEGAVTSSRDIPAWRQNSLFA